MYSKEFIISIILRTRESIVPVSPLTKTEHPVNRFEEEDLRLRVIIYQTSFIDLTSFVKHEAAMTWVLSSKHKVYSYFEMETFFRKK